MKTRLAFIAGLLVLIAIVTGCSNDKSQAEDSQKDEPPAMLEVELKVEPENPQPNQAAAISAEVTQGDDKVDDADEVLFEVWKDGQEEHEEIEGKHEGNGIYTLSKSFAEAGKYYVISHVTARGMHNMPKKEFTVGDSSKAEAQDDHHHDHGDHHDEDVMIHFMPADPIKANEKTTLTAHLQEDTAPLTAARVRFEVWKDQEEKHAFIDAAESKDGEYQAETTFEASGKYHVKVHVEKGELHIHEEHSIDVQ